MINIVIKMRMFLGLSLKLTVNNIFNIYCNGNVIGLNWIIYKNNLFAFLFGNNRGTIGDGLRIIITIDTA